MEQSKTRVFLCEMIHIAYLMKRNGTGHVARQASRGYATYFQLCSLGERNHKRTTGHHGMIKWWTKHTPHAALLDIKGYSFLRGPHKHNLTLTSPPTSHKMRFTAVFFAIAALVAVVSSTPLDQRCEPIEPCACKGQAGCDCC
jgi:hypothetical protein